MLKKRLQRDYKDPLGFSFSNSERSVAPGVTGGADLDPSTIHPTSAYLSTAMAVSVKTET